MKKSFLKLLALGAFSFGSLFASADVVLNSLFSDHAVLQRNIAVPVWGTARDGEKVTVDFSGQKISTVASAGKWMVKLKPIKAGGPLCNDHYRR